MSETTGYSPAQMARFAQRMEQQPLHAQFGLAYEAQADGINDGRSVCRIHTTGLADSGAGYLHAGALYTMMDAASFLPAIATVADDSWVMTIDFHTTMMRAASVGNAVQLIAKVDSATGKQVFVQVEAWELVQQERRLLARGSVIKAVVTRRFELE